MDNISIDTWMNNIREICGDASTSVMNGHEVVSLGEFESRITKLIKDFFSSGNGAGSGIKALYDKAKPSFEKIPTFTMQDLNYTNHMYNEYLKGMEKFIQSECVNLKDPSTLNDEIEKLNSFSDKDDKFITSLFGNGSNVKSCENMTLSEGLSNLEVFIDFIPSLGCYHHTADLLDELVRGALPVVNAQNSSVRSAIMSLYCKSVIRYTEYLMISMINCYNVMVTRVLEKQPLNQPQPQTSKYTNLVLL